MGIKVYTRREFLKAAGLGIAAVVVSGCGLDAINRGTKITPGTGSGAKLPSPIKGVVTVGSKPHAGIAVSDGLDIVFTDAKGKYKLPNKKGDAPFIFVVQPNDVVKSSTAFYRMPFQLEAGQKRIDFVLSPVAAN